MLIKDFLHICCDDGGCSAEQPVGLPHVKEVKAALSNALYLSCRGGACICLAGFTNDKLVDLVS